MNPYKLSRTKKQTNSGIYFLLDKGVIVYIGKSLDVTKRTTQHNDKIWDEYSCIKCSKGSLDREEKKYIGMYSPKYNEVHCYKRVSTEPLLEVFNPEINECILSKGYSIINLKNKIYTIPLLYNKDLYQFEGFRGYVRIKEKYGEFEFRNRKYFFVPKGDKIFLQQKEGHHTKW